MKQYPFLSCILLCFFITASMAQVAEEIVTESGFTKTETEFIDDIVPKRLILENRVLPYEHVREADVPWEKRIWRVIDVREKLNKPFVYPKKYFFEILIEGIVNGDLVAFDKDDFKNMYPPEDVESKLFSMDTTEIMDPDTYETTLKVVRNEINPEDIKRFRVKEIWFFDEEAAALKVRILGIAPIRDVVDDITGEFKYEIPMFWIYYPQARELFAKHQVFNDFNDAAPMTWDDIFQIRQFSSYIYKASNVNDLRLKDIYTDSGYDMLMESERIKMELFNFEHDLWSF